MGDLGITEIGLQRIRGFGPCPDFRFTVKADGGYSYEGVQNVVPLGKRSGVFPGYLFERLARICSELNVLELSDTYPTDFEDMPLMLLVVRYRGGTKTIRNEAGDACPPRLWALVIVIEYTMRQALKVESHSGTEPDVPPDLFGDPLAVSMARTVAAANKQARELGVDAGQCVITVSQDAAGGETRWRVNYGPRNYVGRRGGDLIIDVNPADYSIARVLRGQ